MATDITTGNTNPLFMTPTTDSAEPDDTQPSGVLLLPDSGPNSFDAWKGRIEKSQKNIEDLQPEWDANQKRLLNKKDTDAHKEDLKVPTLFQRVETKKSQLAAQTPRITVSASLPTCETAAPIMEAVINDMLEMPQPDGVDAMVALEEVLNDALVPSGIFAVVIGYEPIIDGTKEIQTGTQPDPNWVPPVTPPGAAGSILGLQAPPQAPQIPVMETVPNVVCEKYSFDHLSPSKLLIPDDFIGVDYDRAAWLGYEFLMDFYLGKRIFKLPDDFSHFVSEDDHLIDSRDKKDRVSSDKRKMIRGFVVFYKASIFDKTVAHPYKQRRLVIIEGLNDPVIHEDSKYQEEQPDGSLGGMVGFPIHIGTLRSVSDSAMPPSDASMSKYQDEEISDGRTDMKLQRKRNIPQRVVDASKFKEGGLAKIEKGKWQAVIPLDGEAFEDGKPLIHVIAAASYPQENFNFDNINQRDLDATWGLGAAPTGTIPGGTSSTSATVGRAAEASSGSRMGRERNKFMHWYARGVQKLASLYQMFMTDTQYVRLVGPDGVSALHTWDKNTIAGKFGFKVLPNSSIDETERRNDFMGWYNLAAASPNINRRELDTEMVKAFGKDPAKLINQPPPAKPEMPKGLTLSIDEKSLNPLNPAFPIIVQILRESGIQIDDATIAKATAQAQTAGLPVTPQVTPPAPPQAGGAPAGPGGPAPAAGDIGSAGKADAIDKHQFDRSGELPGPRS